jgi:uncharacterized membrane protein YhdT
MACERSTSFTGRLRHPLCGVVESQGSARWDQADKWERWAWRLQIIVLVLSALVTIVAALPDVGKESQPWMKWLVVAISALTTLFSGLLSKSGIERTAQIREQGRVKLEALKQRAMLRFTKKMLTEEERLAYLERLIDATEAVEQQHGVHPLVASRRYSKKSDAT